MSRDVTKKKGKVVGAITEAAKAEKDSFSVSMETELLREVDARAKALDLNRSQYFRWLARRELELAARGVSPLQKAA